MPETAPIPPASPEGREPPFQFSLRSLLALQAGTAVFLVLLIQLQILAVLLAFSFTLVFAPLGLRHSASPVAQSVFDLLAGAVMPFLCLLYDPVVFASDSAVRVLGWLAILYQIALLVIWQWLRHRAGVAAAFFAGGFIVGVTLAAVIAVLLAPMAFIGLIVLIGVLGFAPVLTAIVFVRNAVRAMGAAIRSNRPRLCAPLVLAGIVAAVAVPVAINMAFRQQLDPILRPLWPQAGFGSGPFP